MAELTEDDVLQVRLLAAQAARTAALKEIEVASLRLRQAEDEPRWDGVEAERRLFLVRERAAKLELEAARVRLETAQEEQEVARQTMGMAKAVAQSMMQRERQG